MKIFLIGFILIIFIIVNNTFQIEGFQSSQIPLVLYKTGPYKTVPKPILQLFLQNMSYLNCSSYEYFNDTQCKSFIRVYFPPKILKAYESLIPNAYKADLWRYCVLYRNGGIYGDLTQKFLKPYKVNQNYDLILTKDKAKNAVQISFMAAKKRCPFLLYVITNISDDILQKKKGNNSLDITGPVAFCRYYYKFFNIDEITLGPTTLKGLDGKTYNILFDFIEIGGYFKNTKKEIVVKTKMPGHNKNIQVFGKQPKYSTLYRQNKIFR